MEGEPSDLHCIRTPVTTSQFESELRKERVNQLASCVRVCVCVRACLEPVRKSRWRDQTNATQRYFNSSIQFSDMLIIIFINHLNNKITEKINIIVKNECMNNLWLSIWRTGGAPPDEATSTSAWTLLQPTSYTLTKVTLIWCTRGRTMSLDSQSRAITKSNCAVYLIVLFLCFSHVKGQNVPKSTGICAMQGCNCTVKAIHWIFVKCVFSDYQVIEQHLTFIL